MQLSKRQQDIVELVKEADVLTADGIAEQLSLSKSTLRSDLAVLSSIGILEAKPKVGYIYQDMLDRKIPSEMIEQQKVAMIMSKPLLIEATATIEEAIVSLFECDSGSLIVVDQQHSLKGIVSRKDLLRFLINGSSDFTTPIALMMTRMPNVITAFDDDTIIDAARLLQYHEIDSLPVVRKEDTSKVVGKLSKTNILNHYLQHYGE